jgi:hypothetical protein
MFYRIQSGTYVFYATIHKEDEDETQYLYIGSKRRPMCMHIVMDSPTVTIARLQNVSYDERCASNEPMPRKIGTRAMVRGAFACVRKLFPTVKTLLVNDESTFECDGQKVVNANMSFILKGKTWYEDHFQAEPVNKDNYEELKRSYAHSELHTTPFSRIWKHSLDLTNIPRKEALQLYKSSKTWQDFYQAIYRAYQCVPFTKITFYAPFEYFSPRLRTLAGELWTITLTNEDSVVVTEIDADAFPEMDWKPLERRRLRLYGGLIKVRRARRMDLGEGIDI